MACKLVWRGHAKKRVTSASLAYLEKMASASSRRGLRRMSLLVSTLSNMGVHGTAKASVGFSDRSETSFTSFVIMAPTSFSAENATSGHPFFFAIRISLHVIQLVRRNLNAPSTVTSSSINQK